MGIPSINSKDEKSTLSRYQWLQDIALADYEAIERNETEKKRYIDTLNVRPELLKPGFEALPFSYDTIGPAEASLGVSKNSLHQVPQWQEASSQSPEAVAEECGENATFGDNLKPNTTKQKNSERSTVLLKQLEEDMDSLKVLVDTQQKTLERDPNEEHAKILRAFITVVKGLLALKKQQILTGKDIVMAEQERLLKIEKDIRDLTRDLVRGEKAAKIAGKIKLGADIAFFGSMAVSFIVFMLGMATFGLGALLAVAGGVASITSGACQIFQTDQNAKNNELTAKIVVLKTIRERGKENVTNALTHETTLHDHELRMMKEVCKTLRNRNDVIKGMAAAAAA